MTGRISLLVSRDMRVLVEAVRGLEPEVRKQIRTYTRTEGKPLWKDAVAQQSTTRLQNRVLVNPARLSVTDSNVMMKTAQTGKLSSGLPVSQLAGPAEFGANPARKVAQRSGRGPNRNYTRRMGSGFRRPNRKGYVFFPAVREAIPRLASLWVQTAARTVAETFEKVN